MTFDTSSSAATESSPLIIDAAARLRWCVYTLLAVLSIGGMLGRILAVNSVDLLSIEKHLKSQGRADWHKSRPFLSANDRSRWATARALVEHGTYAIDDVIVEPGWDTIDMVKHVGPDGQPHLYSSKPPLLATLLAGEYWLVRAVTGWTLSARPYEMGRLLTIVNNVAPLAVYFVLMASMVERLGRSDFGRLTTMGVATFGTFLTTFAVTINNHIPAALALAASLWFWLRIEYDGSRRGIDFLGAGFFAAFAVTCELPALAFAAPMGLLLAYRGLKPTALFVAPAMAMVAIAALGTNHLAHGTFEPAYAHMNTADPAQDWYKFTYTTKDGKVRKSYFGYPENLAGLDRGERDPAAYVVHTLVGHHGFFSLTPFWLLGVAGLGILMRRREYRLLAFGIAVLTIGTFVFYWTRPVIQRNYGGMSSGLRWTFWLIPLWVVAALPAADYLARLRMGRVAVWLLVALSVLSASYPTWNPWTQPWLFNAFEYAGWVKL